MDISALLGEENDRFTVDAPSFTVRPVKRQAAELKLARVRARFDGQVGRRGAKFQVPAIHQVAEVRERVELPSPDWMRTLSPSVLMTGLSLL